MENVGTDIIAYDWQQVAVNNAFDVRGPDAERTAYIGGSCQTAGGERQIRPGEIVVLFDDLDVSAQYHMLGVNHRNSHTYGSGHTRK